MPLSIWELIETLWNVNKLETYMLNHIEERINRNIVECKFCLSKAFKRSS